MEDKRFAKILFAGSMFAGLFSLAVLGYGLVTWQLWMVGAGLILTGLSSRGIMLALPMVIGLYIMAEFEKNIQGDAL